NSVEDDLLIVTSQKLQRTSWGHPERRRAESYPSVFLYQSTRPTPYRGCCWPYRVSVNDESGNRSRRTQQKYRIIHNETLDVSHNRLAPGVSCCVNILVSPRVMLLSSLEDGKDRQPRTLAIYGTADFSSTTGTADQPHRRWQVHHQSTFGSTRHCPWCTS